MNKKIVSHKDLLVWQKAMDLVSVIYTLTRNFPKDEIYGLSSQLKRAAISIPSNIAEGRIRSGTKEFLHFLRIALGSVAELDTQLEIARREKFISETRYTEVMNRVDEIGRMLSGLIVSLKTKR